MAITYQLGDKLYLNLTNRCTNRCQFCIREYKDGIGGYNLWLESEPTVDQVLAEIGAADQYEEIVFCGFGEPLIRLEAVLEIASRLQADYPQVPIRVNTNGLANLIHEEEVIPKLAAKIDSLSVSLNASNPSTYQQVSSSEFGDEAFPALLAFIKQARESIPQVAVSVVRQPEVDLAACRDLAAELGVEFKVRG